MTDPQTGITPRPHDVSIKLSGPFVEQLTPEQLEGYVRVVTDVHRRLEGDTAEHEDSYQETPDPSAGDENVVDATEDMLRQGMDAHSIPISDQDIAHLAGQVRLAGNGTLSVMDHQGRVLTGRPDAENPQLRERETADPEHPDRPVYS